jgi:protein transport protein SEC39
VVQASDDLLFQVREHHPRILSARFEPFSQLILRHVHTMTDVRSLSAAHIIVLGTELCSKADYEGLRALQQLRPDVLGAELCCRILLTYVSGNEDPAHYVPLLKQLRGGVFGDESGKAVDVSCVEAISEADARKMVQQMRLQQLKVYETDSAGTEDVATRFVLQQAYRVDAETGDLPAILQLVEPFVDQTEFLRRWLISNLLPLLRLDYEYYTEGDSGLTLEAFRGLEGISGLDVLLHKAKSVDGKPYIGRDLRGIVGPWMYGARSSKRRKLSHSFRRASIDNSRRTSPREDSGWQEVNEWILKTSLDDYDLTATAVAEWNGPNDVDLGGYDGPAQQLAGEGNLLSMKYGQAAMATIYATDDSSSNAARNSRRLFERVVDVVQIDPPRHNSLESSLPDSSTQPASIMSMSRTDLFLDNLLEPDHALTWPSAESLSFLRSILTSIQTLRDDLHSQQQLTCRNAANLCLFATQQVQRQELHKLMQNFAATASAETDWQSVREKILWLSRWTSKVSQSQHDEENGMALFWQVPLEEIETEILSAMLTAKVYPTAIRFYLDDPDSSPLPAILVEKLIERETLNAYDNASNGNRTRGGMKRAFELLKAFGPHFPPSSSVNQIEHLIAATHSLSFYHLTLQHGVPFQPVSIRVHHDPISLISKVLEQNSKAYTKLDDLLSIGRGLVAAGLPTSPSEEKDERTSTSEDTLDTRLLQSDHRITYDAIISALSSNDFDTAYSYILTRLSPSSKPSTSSDTIDDISWRAAYAAGRHRAPSSSTSRSAQITLLTKKLDLLSLSLTLVPDPTNLPSMLATWQRCADELEALRAREAAEEGAWDDRGDNLHSSNVPGGFGLEDREGDIAETEREMERRRAGKTRAGRYDEDEAPMGLFDVARGAARAIGKNAFPLRGAAGTQGVKVGDTNAPPRSSEESVRSAAGSGDEGQHRVRKRDMVSNMVTGGLVSGLGWVLGAQPVNKEGAGEHGAEH